MTIHRLGFADSITIPANDKGFLSGGGLGPVYILPHGRGNSVSVQVFFILSLDINTHIVRVFRREKYG